MLYARIDGGLVAEIVEVDPESAPIEARFHPAIVAVCVAVPDPAIGVGWRWTREGGFAPPAAAPTPAPRRHLAPLSFRRRLSPARRAAVTLAASAALEAGDAAPQTWLDDLAASRVVDLDDPDLRAGVAALVKAGLITAAVRDALLADATADEV